MSEIYTSMRQIKLNQENQPHIHPLKHCLKIHAQDLWKNPDNKRLASSNWCIEKRAHFWKWSTPQYEEFFGNHLNKIGTEI